MASSRPRREVWARSPSQSDMEDIGSDSDYSPGSLMIDMGNDGKYKGQYIHLYMYQLSIHVHQIASCTYKTDVV